MNLIKLINNLKYFYVPFLLLFICFYSFYKPKPKLSSIKIRQETSEMFNQTDPNKIIKLNSPSIKVNIGTNSFIKDNDNWYRIIQLSFWKKDFFIYLYI